MSYVYFGLNFEERVSIVFPARQAGWAALSLQPRPCDVSLAHPHLWTLVAVLLIGSEKQNPVP